MVFGVETMISPEEIPLEMAPPGKPVAKPSIFDLDSDERVKLSEACGEKGFRSRQLSEWLFTRYAGGFGEMLNLPKAFRARLAERCLDLDGTLTPVETAGEASSGTRKILSRLADGELVETVLIPAKDRVTVCVSSQVGCGFHCAFCASGLNGCVRSLTRGEIVAQVVRAARLLGRRPDRIVFMGIGEPFANYDNTLWAARRMNAPEPDGLGIGARHITFSTCGVVPGIKRFSGEGMQFELSVSLHAPTNELRDRLMPVNKHWNLDVLIPACRAYTKQTGRIITFEYTLVAGFNDGPEQARELVRLLRPFPSRVNLIPLNPVAEFSGKTPSIRTCERFRDFLMRNGINATLRQSRGRGVNASCGQLRRARSLADAGERATEQNR